MTPAERRRLLELAAKAAGIVLGEHIGIHKDYFANENTGKEWNPADADGDSRRLEVRLMLEVYHAENDGEIVCVVGYSGPIGRILYIMEPHGDNPCEATRLAVLRAAAAIGEAMP